MGLDTADVVLFRIRPIRGSRRFQFLSGGTSIQGWTIALDFRQQCCRSSVLVLVSPVSYHANHLTAVADLVLVR
jgi:hypothetical protein